MERLEDIYNSEPELEHDEVIAYVRGFEPIAKLKVKEHDS